MGRAQSKGSAGLILPETPLPSPCPLYLHAPSHHPHSCNQVPPWPPPSPGPLTLLFHYKSTSARPSPQLLCTPLDSMPILYLFSGSWAGPHASQGPRPGGSSAYFLEEVLPGGRREGGAEPGGRPPNGKSQDQGWTHLHLVLAPLPLWGDWVEPCRWYGHCAQHPTAPSVPPVAYTS